LASEVAISQILPLVLRTQKYENCYRHKDILKTFVQSGEKFVKTKFKIKKRVGHEHLPDCNFQKQEYQLRISSTIFSKTQYTSYIVRHPSKENTNHKIAQKCTLPLQETLEPERPL